MIVEQDRINKARKTGGFVFEDFKLENNFSKNSEYLQTGNDNEM